MSDDSATCEGCGRKKTCLGCDDNRPEAGELVPGWSLLSPLDRWETVTRVDRPERYGPVRVFTDQTGPEYAWFYYSGSTKVTAVAPRQTQAGTPEVRIVEYNWGPDAPMRAVATRSTVYNPDLANVLAEATFLGRGKGWRVSDRPGGGEVVTVEYGSKGKARSALRAAARLHARVLGVKVTFGPEQTRATGGR